MKKTTTKREEIFSYLILVVPGILIYYFVLMFPTFFSVILSLTNYNGGKVFGGGTFKFAALANYSNIFHDNYFFMALKNNIYIVLMSVCIQIPLGFTLAYILSRGLVKGVGIFQTVVYLPHVISPVIIGILFNNFYRSSGSVWMEIVRAINPDAVFDVTQNPMIPVLIVMVWMYTGTYVIIFLANLQKIDVSIIEASKIDGASEWQTLRYIILPALSGVVVTCMILAISGSLKSFDLIYVMTQGGPAHQTTVLSLYMFEKAFQGKPQYPIANAISTVMVVISFVLIGLTKITEKIFGGGSED